LKSPGVPPFPNRAGRRSRLDLRVRYEELGLDRRALHAQLDRDFDHRAKLRSIPCPVLILHTLHDSLVPAWNSEKLAAWAGSKLHQLRLFEDGDHNDIQGQNAGEYQRELQAFIRLVSGG
jgi:pimeloyl-ACP methyl ester carboxylesterase